MLNSWFLIANPSAGNTNFKKSWTCIQNLLETKKIKFSFAFTQYSKHELLIVDEAIKKAVNIDPNKRYDHLTEFIYDLKKPNKKFLNKKRPPLIERSPEKFWQGISFIVFMIILFLLLK